MPQARAVRVSELRFRWRRDLPEVLYIPELTVARGERIFIRGPSGSGKSTLLSLLAGVSLPCRVSRARRDKVLDTGATLEDEALRRLEHLDMGEEALIHRPVTELSVGQQQRVATARALIGAPEIVIADEPTSALDSDMRQAFLGLLLGVERVRIESRNSFANTLSGTDLVVGARSGAINLLLYSVFRIGDATNNISWKSYRHFAKNPLVAWTIPISLGDSHKGFRVLGTNQDYFRHYP